MLKELPRYQLQGLLQNLVKYVDYENPGFRRFYISFKFLHLHKFLLPDPRPWPIIGNLLDVATVSSDMTKAFGELAKRFGEIYSLQMGTKRTGMNKN